MPGTFRQRKTQEYSTETTTAPSRKGAGAVKSIADAGRGQPPRRIMSKKSWLFFVDFILSSTNSIASISSIG